jgi:hypothetical protein
MGAASWHGTIHIVGLPFSVSIETKKHILKNPEKIRVQKFFRRQLL